MMMSPGRYATVGSTLPGAVVGFGGGGGGGGGGGQESAYRPTWGIYRDDKIPASNVIHFDRIEQGKSPPPLPPPRPRAQAHLGDGVG